MIYLDHNATTPLCPAAQAAFAEAGELWANAASVHSAGRAAAKRLEQARGELAEAMGAQPREVVFCSSGSEANNLALKGVAFAGGMGRPCQMVISAIEHDSVRQPARWLGINVPQVETSEVAPNADGVVEVDAILKAIRPDTRLVALMLANHETGALQPVAELAAALRGRGILLFCDAVQALGRVELDVRQLGCDLLSLSAHKFGGPKGVGALYVRQGVELAPLIHGGHQEHEMRAGTANLAGAAAMAAAARDAVSQLHDRQSHLLALEKVFCDQLGASGLPLAFNGPAELGTPGVVNFAIEGVAREDLVVGMDVAGFAISTGAACASGVMEPSPVLQAMGLPEWRVLGGVRISFGSENTLAQAAAAAEEIIGLAHKLGAAPQVRIQYG